MSDAADRGFTVTEIAAMDQPIAATRETTAAFVGRALRGPLNEPVLIHGFGEFRRRFGDAWSRSSLGPAVRQFFEHGGRNLYVVRVGNNARGAMLCLPASGSALLLRAVEPGSSESIRAAVDYDGIPTDNDELFNLTLQRTDPATGHVIDQELFRRASYVTSSNHFVGDLLLTSALARVVEPLPTHRPERTYGSDLPFNSCYVTPMQPGTDGQELSAYDLVGSRRNETGLFALQQVEHFDLLYLPPPGKHRDLDATAVLAAERYCRERGAMLIVDPSIRWQSVGDAIDGVREAGYASPNMLSYFPRLVNRRDTGAAARTAGGALAGLLCKLDRKYGAWHELGQQGPGFSRDLFPAIDIDARHAQLLERAGLNTIVAGAAGAARCSGTVTMGRGSESHRRFARLPVRRFCLQVVHAVDQATRWAVFETHDAELASRLRAQVDAYLSGLFELGALASDAYRVECDAGLHRGVPGVPQGFAVFISMQPCGCDEIVSLTLHQTIAGCHIASTAFAPV